MSRWAAYLHNLGLSGLAESFAHAGRPLAPLLAQLLYIAEPFFPVSPGGKRVRELAGRLEQEDTDVLLSDLFRGRS